MRANTLFNPLDDSQVKAIAAQMFAVDVGAGTRVIQQGDEGDFFYVAESGTFAYLKDGIQVGKATATKDQGVSFGELALLYGQPRAATVRCCRDGRLWAVDRQVFQAILRRGNRGKKEKLERFLSEVPTLAALSGEERSKLADAMTEHTFERGTEVMRQGEEGDAMFVVGSGHLDVLKRDAGGATRVASLQEGDVVGERALLTDQPRDATIRVTSNEAKLYRIDRYSFEVLLGPAKDALQERVRKYEKEEGRVGEGEGIDELVRVRDKAMREDREVAAIKADARKAASLRPRARVRFKDLRSVSVLGKGAFGTVRLVRDMGATGNNRLYALKSISKALVVKTGNYSVCLRQLYIIGDLAGQQRHVINEKRCMAALDSPHLVQLHATYKSRNNLYFLMDYCPGGELFSVLRKEGKFDENTARYYAASVVLAFEHMHSRDIIFRDLKPENLMLTSQGQLKLTDFGFAKVVPAEKGGRTFTLCGTPDYLAPEVIAGTGHGRGADWWTLGVLLFEMMVGHPPFYDSDPMRTYKKIAHAKVKYPHGLSRPARALIGELLEKSPSRRLGVITGGAMRVKQHKFFGKFDFGALASGSLKPPHVPTLRTADDTSNFDAQQETVPSVPYFDDGTGWDDEF
ncbi:MAG: hypothetical protein MHM6MM_004655 [Cercozoa sp. M6MM]